MGLIGLLITVVTFPGVIAHEFAHEKVCEYYDVPVLEVCYFRFGNPAGYVVHEEPSDYWTATMISVAPFLFNTALAVVLFVLIALVVPVDGFLGDLGRTGQFLFWLGASFAIHAFPSTGDANSLWTQTRSRWRESPTALLGLPVIGLIYLANLLNVFWLDVIYAVALFLVVTSLVPIALV